MPATDQLVTGGGLGGIALAVVYVGRLTLDWLRERRKAPVETSTAAVTDAATANAVLLSTLESVQGENKRLQGRVKTLEDENAAKDRKLADLEGRLADIAAELAELRGPTGRLPR